MSKTVVGLYDDLESAEKALQALDRAHFDRSKMHLAVYDGSNRDLHLEGGTDLADTLSNYGIPEDEAMLYAEGVRRGGTVVLMRVPDDRAAQAAELLRTPQSVSLPERAADWKRRGSTPHDRAASRLTPEQPEAERMRSRSTPAGHPEDQGEAFRSHYDATYGTTGRPYDAFEPAYHYGYSAGLEGRSADRDYDEAEPELRRGYESRFGDGSFEQVKDAIRHAYTLSRSPAGTRTRD